jgi:hypothetical protein
MRLALLAFVLLTVAAGCSLFNAGDTEAPTKEVKVFSSGERAEYDLMINSYTVWYKSGQVMFRATGWNGSRGFPMRWAPTTLGMMDWRIQTDKKGIIFFNYGLKGGKEIRWGAFDKYEGWFENGNKKYDYSYRTRKFTEWDINGNILKQVNQGE